MVVIKGDTRSLDYSSYRVILGLCWGYIGVTSGLYWCYIKVYLGPNFCSMSKPEVSEYPLIIIPLHQKAQVVGTGDQPYRTKTSKR